MLKIQKIFFIKKLTQTLHYKSLFFLQKMSYFIFFLILPKPLHDTVTLK